MTLRQPAQTSQLISHLRHSRRVVSLKEPQPGTPSIESVSASQRSPAVKQEISGKEIPIKPGSSYPAVKMSTFDIEARPIYEPNGKPITDIDLDTGTCQDLVQYLVASLPRPPQTFQRTTSLGGDQVQI